MSFGISGFVVTGGSLTGLVSHSWSAGYMHDFWFDVGTPVAVNRTVMPSGTGLFPSGDSLFFVASGASTVTDYSWPYTVAPNRPVSETVARTVSNSGIIIPATGSDSLWTYQGTGTGLLILSSSLGTRVVSGAVTTSTGQASPTYTLLGYAPGSLRYAIATGVDTRISGKSAAAAKPIYSTQNHVTPAYTRNTGCWAYGVDLTPISPWNSDGGNYKAGVLVSPKHVVFATHYPVTGGTVIRFVATDNTVISRTVTGLTPLPGYVPYYPDVTIGGLDSAVPASISFARILPASYTGQLYYGVSRAPTINLDYEEKALVSDLSTITSNTGYHGAMVSEQAPINTTRVQFYEDQIGGDSGNPICVIIDGKIVLLTVATFAGPGFGTNIAYWKDGINTVMGGLGGGYTLTEADLSAYTSYV
jgi:hypothetical protein